MENTTGNASWSSGMMTGMFRDRDSAERAYQALHSRGYTKEDVNLMMSDDTRKRHFGDDTAHTELGNKALEGTGVGSAIGGTLGAIIGAIAAIGTSVALPGLGLVVAGPLAAALAGAGAGGLTGGLLGALVGSGIPEEHAKVYESGIKEGGIVMGVKPRSEDDARYFESEWRNSRAEHLYTGTTGTTMHANTSGSTMTGSNAGSMGSGSGSMGSSSGSMGSGSTTGGSGTIGGSTTGTQGSTGSSGSNVTGGNSGPANGY